jgi:hypothetical protein
MEIQSDLAPPAQSESPRHKPPKLPDISVEGESRFSRALAEVEKHRGRVRMALSAALVARLLFEFQFVSLLRDGTKMFVQIPYIGLAMLSYLVVLMWLSARTRDRFGFGMALGLGVLEAAYLLVNSVMYRPFSFTAVGGSLVVALAHIPMAYFAFKASEAYPPRDSKRPWIIGFATALVFLAIPWFAPALVEAMSW